MYVSKGWRTRRIRWWATKPEGHEQAFSSWPNKATSSKENSPDMSPGSQALVQTGTRCRELTSVASSPGPGWTSTPIDGQTGQMNSSSRFYKFMTYQQIDYVNLLSIQYLTSDEYNITGLNNYIKFWTWLRE